MSIADSAIDIHFRTLPWQDKDVQQQDTEASVDQHHFQFGRKASLVVEEIQVDEEEQRVLVRLPDLFCPAFGVVRDAAVNPHYEEVRQNSEAWLAQAASFDDSAKTILHKTNVSYFCAVVMPDAAATDVRYLFDWCNCVIIIDDQFDHGVITGLSEAQTMMDSLLSIMEETPQASAQLSKPAILQAHDDLYLRIKASSPPSVTRRYAACMRRYAAGVVEQVSSESGDKRIMSITTEDLLETRRRTVAVEPLFPLIERVLCLNLPEAVFEHWTIREFQRIMIDLVLISNDIISYRREEAEGNLHNLVAVARRTGLTAQEAFDSVGSMLDARYNDWAVAFEALPSWGAQVDEEVMQYIRGIRNVAVGNVNWSFHSERYFGKETATVKETLFTDVLADIVVPVAA